MTSAESSSESKPSNSWLERARTAVNGDAPGGAGEEGAFIVEVLPSTIAIELQERLLDRVFGVVRVEQHCKRHAKHEPRLALHKRRELRVFAAGKGLRAPLGCRRKLRAVASQLYCPFTR